MFSPKNQQIKICLLKGNLEDIGNKIIAQYSSLPELTAENEQRYLQAMEFLRMARCLIEGMEQQKLEDARLTAKLMQLKNECVDLTKCMDKSREQRNELENLLKQEEIEIDQQISQYLTSSHEIAELFRNTQCFYNEEEMKKNEDIVNETLIKLEAEEKTQQYVLKELQKKLDSLAPNVPDNILAILGKNELEDKLTAVTNKRAELKETRERLQKQRF